MKLHETGISGAYLIEMELHEDERGFFARTWSAPEMQALGLDGTVTECSVSYNAKRGTLRGMHYQVPPHAEAKLIRVLSGAIHDVVLDLRPESPSFRGCFTAQLSSETRSALYVPEGCAHGFLTLVDNTEILYQMSAPYVPESARGVRWDDPLLRDCWPFPPIRISPRDQSFGNVA